MLNNLQMRSKLFLFPILFILIIIISGFIYGYFTSYANDRAKVVTETRNLVQNLLDGRIAVYQFLRDSNENTKQNVVNIFTKLEKDTVDLKADLTNKRNIELVDTILTITKEYISSFDIVAKFKIEDAKNGVFVESDLTKQKVIDMSEIGKKLEDAIFEINTNAVQLRDNANNSLDRNLIILVVISIIVFILISILI